MLVIKLHLEVFHEKSNEPPIVSVGDYGVEVLLELGGWDYE